MLPPAASHRILIVSDAWEPQVNGVVRTLATVAKELRAMGHVVEIIGPNQFRTVRCPTYPDIRLSLLPRRRLIRMIEAFQPDALHIATEGPLGLAARSWAKSTGFAFTTAFHTRFAEYVKARTGLPLRPLYAWMRRFHGASQGTMVATESLRGELTARDLEIDTLHDVYPMGGRGDALGDIHYPDHACAGDGNRVRSASQCLIMAPGVPLFI